MSGSILLTILILYGIISSDHEEQLLGFKYYCEFIQCSCLSLRWIIAVMVMLINHTEGQTWDTEARRFEQHDASPLRYGNKTSAVGLIK